MDDIVYTNGHDPSPWAWHAHDPGPLPPTVDGPGLHPWASPAPDGPGATGPGAGAHGAPGPRGHGAPEWYDLAEVSTGPAPTPLCGYIAAEPGAVTVLYGDGGTGKGTLTAAWVAELVNEGLCVGIIDAEGHPREWARRVSGFLGGPVPKGSVLMLHTSGELVLEDYRGVLDLIVLDSAAYFTGSSTAHDEWAAAAVMVQEQARTAGVPLLVIAHTTNDGKRIYGSRFWHNTARVTLGLEADDAGQVTLRCTKASDQPNLAKGQAWTVTVRYRGIVPVLMELEGALA